MVCVGYVSWVCIWHEHLHVVSVNLFSKQLSVILDIKLTLVANLSG